MLTRTVRFYRTARSGNVTRIHRMLTARAGDIRRYPLPNRPSRYRNASRVVAVHVGKRLVLRVSHAGKERVPRVPDTFRRGRICGRIHCKRLLVARLGRIGTQASPARKGEHRLFRPFAVAELRKRRVSAHQSNLIPSVAHRRILVQRKPSCRLDFHRCLMGPWIVVQEKPGRRVRANRRTDSATAGLRRSC